MFVNMIFFAFWPLPLWMKKFTCETEAITARDCLIIMTRW